MVAIHDARLTCCSLCSFAFSVANLAVSESYSEIASLGCYFMVFLFGELNETESLTSICFCCECLRDVAMLIFTSRLGHGVDRSIQD